MELDLRISLRKSSDLYAFISKKGSIEPLSQGWNDFFSHLEVNSLSDLFANVTQEDSRKLEALIEKRTPALIRLNTGQQTRSVRFTLTPLNENESLISGFDITNELKPEDTEISKYGMLEEIFTQAPCLAAVTVGEEFKFIFANTLYKKLVGGRDIAGLPLNEAIPNLDPEVWKILRKVYTTGEVFEANDLKMVGDWNDDGTLIEKFFTLVYSPLRNSNNEVIGLWTLAFDTTESKKAESLLNITKRVSAMGSMAANVAHEINNPLTYVMGNIEVLSKTAEADSTSARLLHNTSHGLMRIQEIVNNLKGLSKKPTQKHSRFSINEALDEGLRYAQLTTDKVATVSVSCPDEVTYYGSRGEFVQVILNLVINASNAMPNRRKIDNLIDIVAIRDGNDVHITVEDNGRGIEEEYLSKIFDPFYTSKHGQEGTGLGLALCQKMVHEMNGSISVKSKVGVGTQFEIILKDTSDL